MARSHSVRVDKEWLATLTPSDNNAHTNQSLDLLLFSLRGGLNQRQGLRLALILRAEQLALLGKRAVAKGAAKIAKNWIKLSAAMAWH